MNTEWAGRLASAPAWGRLQAWPPAFSQSAWKTPVLRQLPFACRYPAGLGTMGQNVVSREEASSATYVSLGGQAVSSCCDGIAFMECRHWHFCTILFVFYFILPSKEKHYQNQGSPWCSPQVVDIWLLVWIMYGKSLTVWVVPGVGLFLFLFLLLILSHCILYQLLIHHFEGGRKYCIAICKLFYYFFIIIKGLTFSSHHCEITDLSEWNVTLKRLVCWFLCSFSIGVGAGWEGWELEMEGLLRSCECFSHCTFFQKTAENGSIFFIVLACPSLLSLSCNWSFIWI